MESVSHVTNSQLEPITRFAKIVGNNRKKKTMDNWTIMQTWNDALERSDRVIEPRERLWASELGGSMIDRYYKLRGTPYTNPPNSRSMRKFMAGDIWEWIIKTVLIKSGIPFEQQERVEVQYEGMLLITGKIDFIAGGSIDYDRALERLNGEDIPDFIKNPAKAIIESFKAQYPTGLPKKIIEVKSVGSFIFEDLLSKDNPRTHHMLQAAIYKKAKDLPTDILYVCRDDCRLLQYSIDTIFPQLEKEIKEDLAEITEYHRQNVAPPKEDLLIWDKQTKKFKTNWKIQYSPYLSMLYTMIGEDGKEKAIETPDEYFEAYTPLVSSWNRVITRMKNGDNMTKSNLEKITEMESKGFSLSSLGLKLSEVKNETKSTTT